MYPPIDSARVPFLDKMLYLGVFCAGRRFGSSMDSWWKAIKWATAALLSGVLVGPVIKLSLDSSPPSLSSALAKLGQFHLLVPWVIVLFACCLLWLFADRKEKLEQLAGVTFFKACRDLDAEHDMSITGYHDYFLSSPESAKAEHELATKGRVLILGRPAGGKTRLAYSLAKKAKRSWVLRLPSGFNDYKSLVFSKIPPRPSVLWIVDNLNTFQARLDFAQVQQVLARQCDLKIIATCREGKELEDVSNDPELAAFIEPLLPGTTCPNFSGAALDLLAEKTGKPNTSSGYDGTPGSVTLGLGRMRKRLQDSTIEERELMKAMFLLRTAFIYSPTERLATGVFAEIYRLEAAEEKVEAAAFKLKRDGFLREGESLAPAHDCYLTPEFFLHYPKGGQQLDQHLLALGEVVEHHGDPADRKSIGIFWSNRSEYDRALPYLRKAATQDPEDGVLGHAFALSLYRIGRLSEAVEVLKGVVASNPYYLEALCNLVLFEVLAGVPAEEALPVFEKLGRVYNLYRVSGEPALLLRRSVAGALALKGEVLRRLGRYDEALQAYDDVLRRFGDSHSSLTEPIADALLGKGVVLGCLSRHEDSINAWSEVLSRFKDATNPELRIRVARAGVNKGESLSALGRRYEAVAVLTDIAARFRGDEDPKIRIQFAKALVERGFALRDLDRDEEAIQSYDEVSSYFDRSTDAILRTYVACAKVQKAFALSRLSRHDGAVRSCDWVVRRYGSEPDTALKRHVAKAMLGKAVFLTELNRESEAKSVLKDMVRRFRGSTDDLIMADVDIAKTCLRFGEQGQLKLAAAVAKISF